MSLPGFEKETHELSDFEVSIIPLFIKGFIWRLGPDKAITSDEIISRLNDNDILKKEGYKLTGPRLRKIIGFIRCEELVPGLVASSAGYYRTADKNEMIRYIKSLEGRIEKITAIRDKAVNYLNFLSK